MTEREAIEVLTDDKTCLGTTKCDAITWTKLTPAMETAVNAMMEIQQYREIGTVEECREAMERQRAKKPQKVNESRIRYTDGYICPSCGGGFSGTGIADYCYHCGQAIDWSE